MGNHDFSSIIFREPFYNGNMSQSIKTLPFYVAEIAVYLCSQIHIYNIAICLDIIQL